MSICCPLARTRVDDLEECCAACRNQGVRRQQVEGHRAKGWQTGKGTSRSDYVLRGVDEFSELTSTRHASSTQKSILVGSTERLMSTACIFPSLARWLRFMIPQLSSLIEHCRSSVGIRSSFEEFLARDCGSGWSTQAYAGLLCSQNIWDYQFVDRVLRYFIWTNDSIGFPFSGCVVPNWRERSPIEDVK